MNNFQNSVHEKLFQLQKKYGVANTIEIARGSLTAKTSVDGLKPKLNGEICEVVLEILLNRWIIRNAVNAAYLRSMILPDVESHNKKFLTEIDMVLFAPWCIYCIECKSFSGNKRLIGNGTLISSNGRTCDVYKQNVAHLQVLHKIMKNFCIADKPVYKMILFNFSVGELRDDRNKAQKAVLPLTNEHTLLNEIYQESNVVWDMPGIRAAIPQLTKFSDDNRQRHLAYVKSLTHERD